MAELTTKVEYITPSVASEYIRHNKFNRPLNKRHLDFLSRQMKEGKWVLNGEPIVFDEDGNLSDGQHRLMACINADVGFYTVVTRGVEKDSFASFDQGKNRSYADIFSIAEIPNANIISSIVNKYFVFHCNLSALNNPGHGGNSKYQGYKAPSKREMLEIYNSAPETFQWALKTSQSAEKNNVRVLARTESGGLAAYLVLDLKHDEEVVSNFINQLYKGVSNFKCIEILHRKLINSQLSSIKMSSQLKTNLLAKTWNLFISNRDCKVLSWRPEEGKIKFN